MDRRRDERGTVAIMVAFLSLVVLSMAALAVDLGMARTSRAAVQKSVDASALSAAGLLPVSTEAEKAAVYQAVADYLSMTENWVRGQAPVILPGHLADGAPANGEVVWITNPVSGVVDTMRVIAPSANVGFRFAGVLGVDSVDVGGEATVQVRTPLPEMTNILPVWLPSTCVYGPLAGDIGATPVPEPDASPSYTLNTPRTGNPSWSTGSVSPSSAVYAATDVTVDVTINGIPAGKRGAVVRFTFGDTQYVDYRVTWPNLTTAGDTRTVTIALDSHVDSRRVPSGATVSNPDETWTVTSTAGTWEVWPLIPDGQLPPALPLSNPPVVGMKFPRAQVQNQGAGSFTVTGGGKVACSENQRGNFGQLDSPRTRGPLEASQKQTVYARNVAYGLDHQLAAFAAPSSFECAGDGLPAGALIDAVASRDGSNCLYVDPGNDPQGLTDGLLGGGRITQGEGRLEEPTNPSCGRSELRIGNRDYNNDTLSCYLKPGYTLADIAKDDGVPFDALDKSVLDSPRFFWVAVVHAPDRQLKKFLAIKTFAPVFLTDETVSSPASDRNGLVLNNGGKVQSMQLFGFNAAALPVEPDATTVDYQPGDRKVVRLID
jgi:hypothetical protein